MFQASDPIATLDWIVKFTDYSRRPVLQANPVNQCVVKRSELEQLFDHESKSGKRLAGNRSLSALIMIVSNLRPFALGGSAANLTHWSSINSKHRREIVNFLLFMLAIFLIVAGIALVPTRSELRTRRARVIHNRREQGNSLRS